MSDSPDSSVPATPDEQVESNPASPGSDADESSEASTPLDPPSASSDALPQFSSKDPPRRVPSLRTVSDPHGHSPGLGIHPNSSVTGTLNNARRPPPAASSLPMDLMAKARALQAERAGLPRPNMNPMGSPAPMSGSASPRGFPGGVPGNLKLPGMGGPSRPPAQGFPRSAPAIPGAKKPSLADRRGAMKLGGLPGAPSPAPTPKLSDMNGGSDTSGKEDAPRGDSKMNEFKNYIDTQKGWITFDGAATITRTGVNFASGAAFSISLDEVDILDELGKGNYGTVYRVRHARPKVPRFGQGLSGFKPASRQNSSLSDKDESSGSEGSPSTPRATRIDGTTGRVMAMKEIRLELDEAKFTTILKELVILHECSSPYIIDFYGAFFQEGAVYMCIEYMDGGSIDKLYDGGIPENVLKKITYSTIMGLKSLKDEHNIIHRDVKPTNILVNSRGQVKICDFGVSGNLVASIAKTNIGCQSYMAPERISGGALATGADGTYSVQSDIWSLGLTIIECAMGKYPYPPEISATIFGQLNAIVEGDPPDLPAEGYSAQARDFVKSCLNKNPKKRHTYPMLLLHPWIKSLSKPETITEEAEAESEAMDNDLADAAAKQLNINEGSGDSEVAEWVSEVMERKKKGLQPPSAERPALHAAPLDSVSPAASLES
ncbi:MAP kinase kinase PBS2 [Diaporthe amygdali]|uniref:MAP kinase kinase PBS2 n=1 Tax=Phomopsis amygdali TaxID=1214568 RepID=UPI0022FEEE7F|nr:MAP kinase kinase PBS2 [Diaporthe amygdali]KAJ0123039.1 MAP kinase kinase PBS2 [Diaporthe amygdali]